MRRTTLALAALAAAIATTTAAAGSLAPSTQLYVPQPDQGAVKQIATLKASGDKADAALVQAMVDTPQAVWLTGGSPNDARVAAQTTTLRAAGKNQLPVLVLYDVPFRDCSQYSAGGAADAAAYAAWIDGVARGLGDRPALVLLEPDGLGIIPFYKQFMGEPEQAADTEWCRPSDAAGSPLPGANPAARFAEIHAAVLRLKQDPNARVYLDGTHSSWLGAGDAADRLIKAGVDDADGFFLNVSNYEPTAHLAKYGSWIAQCIGITENVSWWHVGWCASQYYPASPGDFSTWHLTDEAYAGMSWAIQGVPRKHAVIDTSRNGRGAWTPTAWYPDAQTWCNPPGRGAGLGPTTNTGDPLVDAYLWAKTP